MRPRISSKPALESYEPSIRNITSRLFESVRKDAETKETFFCAGSSSYSNIPSNFNQVLKYVFSKPKFVSYRNPLQEGFPLQVEKRLSKMRRHSL